MLCIILFVLSYCTAATKLLFCTNGGKQSKEWQWCGFRLFFFVFSIVTQELECVLDDPATCHQHFCTFLVSKSLVDKLFNFVRHGAFERKNHHLVWPTFSVEHVAHVRLNQTILKVWSTDWTESNWSFKIFGDNIVVLNEIGSSCLCCFGRDLHRFCMWRGQMRCSRTSSRVLPLWGEWGSVANVFEDCRGWICSTNFVVVGNLDIFFGFDDSTTCRCGCGGSYYFWRSWRSVLGWWFGTWSLGYFDWLKYFFHWTRSLFSCGGCCSRHVDERPVLGREKF